MALPRNIDPDAGTPCDTYVHGTNPDHRAGPNVAKSLTCIPSNEIQSDNPDGSTHQVQMPITTILAFRCHVVLLRHTHMKYQSSFLLAPGSKFSSSGLECYLSNEPCLRSSLSSFHRLVVQYVWSSILPSYPRCARCCHDAQAYRATLLTWT